MNRLQKNAPDLSLAMGSLQSRLRVLALSTLSATLAALALFASAALAQVKTESGLTTDPVLEKRVLALSEDLRCLVCQNQTIADSNADLAVDLRNQVREKMTQGWSDEKIIDFMVARYGDFVLYRPPFKGITVLLWAGPFAMLLLGGFFFVRKLKTQVAQPEPSAARLQEAAQLLGTRDKDSA